MKKTHLPSYPIPDTEGLLNLRETCEVGLVAIDKIVQKKGTAAYRDFKSFRG